MTTSTDRRYEHFSAGDDVTITIAWRTYDVATETVEVHQAGLGGVVRSVSNAGVRGLEYTVETDEGLAFGVPAGSLELVRAVDPAVPWHGQGSYRDGRRVQ